MVDPELGVAIVGVGHWGSKLVRNFSDSEGWDLRWVCDVDKSRAHQALGSQYSAAVTSSVSDLLDDAQLTAVAVATPAESHATLAMSVLAAGKHVMVEKPLASSLPEAETMVRFAKARGLVLMCDHTYCYARSARTIRALVQRGAIGQIRWVDSVRINRGVVRQDVDVFWDLAPHDLSVLDFILPDDSIPTSVSAHGTDPIRAGRACTGRVTVTLSGGGVARVHLDWLSPAKMRHTIIRGSHGTIVWDDLNPDERVRIYDKTSVHPGRSPTADVTRMLAGGEAALPAEREPLAAVVEEFRLSIVHRRCPLTDGQAGLRVLRVLEGIATSLRTEGELVPLQWHQ